MINLALLSLLLVCNATEPNSPNLRNSKFSNTTKKHKTKQEKETTTNLKEILTICMILDKSGLTDISQKEGTYRL
jgi:hypothetical protein